jgi:hypothetical protein
LIAAIGIVCTYFGKEINYKQNIMLTNINIKILLICAFSCSTVTMFAEKAIAINKNNSESLVIAQSYNTLNRQKWEKLVQENLERKELTDFKETLSFSEVRSIIGFSPTQSKSNQYTWEDEVNKMKIIVRFHDDQIMDLKGIGFKN